MNASRLEASTGHRRWAIAEGHIASSGEATTDEEHRSKHETLFLLNAGDDPAHVALSIYFSDRDPVGPFRYTVEPRRTVQVTLAEIDAIPRDLDFASLIESDAPIVVLATRRRTAEPDSAPLTQIAFAG
jgi:hypothetical protein